MNLKTSHRVGSNIEEKLPKPIYRYLRDKHECLGCGRCCHCYPIKVDGEDIRVMAFHLGLSVKEFKQKYTKPYPGDARWSTFKNTEVCDFLDGNNKCKIYKARPKICRDYPLMRGTRIPQECAKLNELVAGLFDENGNPRPILLVPYSKDGKGY